MVHPLLIFGAGVAVGYAVGVSTPKPQTVQMRHRGGQWPAGAKSPYFTETPQAPTLFRGERRLGVPKTEAQRQAEHAARFPGTPLPPRGTGLGIGTRAGMIIVETHPSGGYIRETPERKALLRGGWKRAAKSPYFTETPQATPLFKGGQWPNLGGEYISTKLYEIF